MSPQNTSSRPELKHGTVIFYHSSGYGFIRPDDTPAESIDFENRSSFDIYFSLERERSFRLNEDYVGFSHLTSGTRPYGNGGDRVVFTISRSNSSRASIWGFEARYEALCQEIGHRPLIRAIELMVTENGQEDRTEIWRGWDLVSFRKKFPAEDGVDPFPVTSAPPIGLKTHARWLEVRHYSGVWLRLHPVVERNMLRANPARPDRWRACVTVDQIAAALDLETETEVAA